MPNTDKDCKQGWFPLGSFPELGQFGPCKDKREAFLGRPQQALPSRSCKSHMISREAPDTCVNERLIPERLCGCQEEEAELCCA